MFEYSGYMDPQTPALVKIVAKKGIENFTMPILFSMILDTVSQLTETSWQLEYLKQWNQTGPLGFLLIKAWHFIIL